MSIDRVGSAANAQVLLNQLRNAESTLNNTSQQVSSGNKSSTYTGYGFETAALEAARSKGAHADADIQTATQALNQLDLQDTQLSQLSDLANQVRLTLTNAVADGDASTVMAQMSGYYQEAVQVLNSKVGNTYIYGGDKGDTAPVIPTTLADLAALPSVSAAFANGTNSRSVRVGDGQTITTGPLASDVATQLFQVFRDVAQYDQSVNGPFASTINSAQTSFIQGEVTQSSAAADAINSQAATNGNTYKATQDIIAQLNLSSTAYKSFAANIQDADMAEALSKLSQNQVALQAVLQVTAKLNQDSLLNYM